MKKVILIQPYVGIFDTITKNIPVGLLAAARYIHQDYEVVIIDQRLGGWRRSLRKELDSRVLCVGITCLTGHQIYFASKCARFVKSISPQTPVVFGGIHPSLLPRQTLKEDYIDFVVIGEGEIALKELVSALEQDKNIADIAGLAFKQGNDIIVNDRNHFLELAKLPAIPYHLIDIKKYKGLSAQNMGNAFYIEGGRECIHNCTFCVNTSFNKRRWRPYPVEAIIREITYLNSKYGITGFFIIDDSFFIRKERVTDFAEAIRRNNLKIEWCCEANLLDLIRMAEEELAALEGSGLTWLSVGVEAVNAEILKHLKKNIRIADLFEFNRKIQNYDINVRYNFMTGYLWDNEQTIRETVDVCLRLTENTNKIMVQPLYITVPLPGTEYLAECEKHGFKTPKSLKEWSLFDPFSVMGCMPWLDKNKKKLFENVMYTSFFIDYKPVYHSNISLFGKLISIFGRIYKPIARFRFKHLFNFMFIEKYYFSFSDRLLRKRIEK